MHRVLPVLVLLALAVSCSSSSKPSAAQTSAQPPAAKADPLEKLHWRLGVQAWTFRKLSLFETLETCKKLDLHYIEMYPGQKLAPDSDVKADHNMSADQIDKLPHREHHTANKAMLVVGWNERNCCSARCIDRQISAN